MSRCRTRSRVTPLAAAAATSAVLLLALLAARLVAWDQLRGVRFGYGGYVAVVTAGPEGVHSGVRRTIAPWRPTWGAGTLHAGVTNRSGYPLDAWCLGVGERWVLPGLWMGAGRAAFVDYVDVILPNWLTMPLCLLLPALWFRRCRRQRSGSNFEVVVVATPAA